MMLNPVEPLVGLDKLCIKICNDYQIPDKIDDLKSVVESELSATILKYVEKNTKSVSLTSKLKSNDKMLVLSCPINDVSTLKRFSLNKWIDIIIEHVDHQGNSSDVTDTEGNIYNTEICNQITQNLDVMKIRHNNDGIWEAKVYDSYLKLINMDMYIRCWKTNNLMIIRDFINDTFNRINEWGKYQKQNESVSDKVTYKLTYNPDKVEEYLRNNDLYESNDELDIQNFMDNLAKDDDNIELLESSFGSMIIKTSAAYAIGKTVLGALGQLTDDAIPPHNPNTDRYKKYADIAEK